MLQRASDLATTTTIDAPQTIAVYSVTLRGRTSDP